MWGYISRPDVSRGNRQYINFFVNHRPVNSQTLSYAAEDNYRTLLMTGRHPIVVLNIELDPRMVDANVHPQKVEVKFADERGVFSAVQQAVRQALSGYRGVPNLNIGAKPGKSNGTDVEEQEELRYGPTYEAKPTPSQARSQDEAATLTSRSSTPRDDGSVSVGSVGSVDKEVDWLALASEAEQTAQGSSQPKEQRSASQPVESRRPLPPLRIVGQITSGYITCEGPEGMYIVDQHRASERVLYEHILAAMGRGGEGTSSLTLPQPVSIPLAEEQAAELAERRTALAGLGFKLEVEEQATVFSAVPEVLAAAGNERLAEAIGVVAADVLRQQNAQLWQDTLAISLACHSAASSTEQLEMTRARELIAELEGCQMPRSCAHGLPTLLLVSKAQLEREFKRTGY